MGLLEEGQSVSGDAERVLGPDTSPLGGPSIHAV